MTRTLMTLFEELAYDELSTLSMGLPQSGVLTEERERQIVSLVNSGLLNLYSRFPLKESEVIVEMLSHRTVYPLNSKYAHSKANEPDAGDIYIFDTEECPFPDDVLRVISCQSGHGYPLPLNDPGLPHSVFTPRPDAIQFVHPDCPPFISVVYQAKHPVLTLEQRDQEIELPDMLWGALRAWVAHRIFSSMATDVSNVKSAEHFQTYQRIISDVENLDLASVSLSMTSCKFDKNGWT